MAWMKSEEILPLPSQIFTLDVLVTIIVNIMTLVSGAVEAGARGRSHVCVTRLCLWHGCVCVFLRTRAGGNVCDRTMTHATDNDSDRTFSEGAPGARHGAKTRCHLPSA